MIWKKAGSHFKETPKDTISGDIFFSHCIEGGGAQITHSILGLDKKVPARRIGPKLPNTNTKERGALG